MTPLSFSPAEYAYTPCKRLSDTQTWGILLPSSSQKRRLSGKNTLRLAIQCEVLNVLAIRGGRISSPTSIPISGCTVQDGTVIITQSYEALSCGIFSAGFSFGSPTLRS